jgi:hypothetical protein
MLIIKIHSCISIKIEVKNNEYLIKTSFGSLESNMESVRFFALLRTRLDELRDDKCGRPFYLIAYPLEIKVAGPEDPFTQIFA